MSTQKKDVEAFLKGFKEKLGFWGVVFLDDRGKNFKTLAELEIRPVDRTKVLEELQAVHYSEGPLEESFHGGKEMWVFGYMLKNKEI